MTKTQALTVEKRAQGETLQDFLARRLGCSKRKAKDLLDARRVFVNGRRVWMAHHALRGGDVVNVPGAGDAAAPARRAAPAGNDSIRVLHEDPAFVVIDKPAGALSTGAGSVEETLTRSPRWAGATVRAVHRLDRDTTGCLILATKPGVFDRFVELFKRGKVLKLYHAIVQGSPAEREFAIRGELDGRPAVTHARVLSGRNGYTHLRLRIDTGRTHQIRRHLASVRLPLLGDPLHGRGEAASPAEMDVPRQMLHAAVIEFPHPESGARLRVESPLPRDFRAGLRRFGLISALACFMASGAARADEEPSPTAEPVYTSRIRLEFGRTSSLKATLTAPHVAVSTPFADIPLHPPYIRTIRRDLLTAALEIEFRNGDVLRDVALREPIRLETTCGPIVLPAERILPTARPTPLRLILELTDGTSVEGTPSLSAVSALSTNGPVSVPLAEIMEIAFPTPPDERRMLLWSGVELRDPQLPDPLPVEAVFGALNVPGKVLRRVRVLLNGGPESLTSLAGNVAARTAGATALASHGAEYLNDGRTATADSWASYASGITPAEFSVRLARTTWVSCVRFLPWDRGHTTQGYIVEVQDPRGDWETVADRRLEARRGWQEVNFSPRQTCSIRVVGHAPSEGAKVRIIELEAYSFTPDEPPPALAPSGADRASPHRVRPRR